MSGLLVFINAAWAEYGVETDFLLLASCAFVGTLEDGEEDDVDAEEEDEEDVAVAAAGLALLFVLFLSLFFGPSNCVKVLFFCTEAEELRLPFFV